MAITEYKTRTGVELVAEGIVSAIYMNNLKEVKERGKPGSSWIPTHIVNIVVDGAKIGLGMTDKPVLGVKDADGTYHDLVKGMKISVVITENGEYKGVKQYNGRPADVIVLEKAPEGVKEAPMSAPRASYTAKRDNSGMHTGHALNGALNLLRGNEELEYTKETVVDLAKAVHSLTTEMKDEYAEKNPSMSEYDVGAAVGHAVLNATRDAGEVGELRGIAEFILYEVVPDVSEFVKEKENGDKPAKAPAKKPAARKPVAKKPAAKSTEAVIAPNDDDIPTDAYNDTTSIDDDDIPF